MRLRWSEFEKEYASFFHKEMGAPAKSFRMALGALIIKEKLGISDRETVEQIKENPYLQYFIGMSSYSILKTADCWTFAFAKKTLSVKPSAILKVKLQPVFSIMKRHLMHQC